MSARAVLADLLASGDASHPDASELARLAWREVAVPWLPPDLRAAYEDALAASLGHGILPWHLCAYDLGRSSGMGAGRGRQMICGLRVASGIGGIAGSVLLEIRIPRAVRDLEPPRGWVRIGASWRQTWIWSPMGWVPGP